jgi:hypothetical protein
MDVRGDVGNGSIVYAATGGGIYKAVAPPAIALSSPANGATGVSTSAVLSWQGLPSSWCGSRYDIMIDDDESFGSPSTWSLYNGTSKTVNLSCNTTYHWKVQSSSVMIPGSWSGTRSFTTTACGGGGCPFVFSWNGETFTEDNNILPQSEYRGNENKDVTDYYRLLKTPVEKEGTYTIELREFEHEHSYLDEIELLAIDHPSDNDIAVLEDGSLVQYTTPFTTMANLPDGSANVSWRISALDDTTYKESPGKSLELVFGSENEFDFTSFHEGGVLLGGLTLHGKYLVGLPKKQSIGTIGIGRNSIGKKANFGFRERNTLVYVPLERLEQSVTLNFAEYVALDVAKLALKVPSTYEKQSLRLLSATHNKKGDVTNRLTYSDGSVGELEPGQSIQLQFEATPVAKDMKRSFILKSYGRYEKLAETDESFPVEYSLYQNYPNPFNPVTTFYYSLPENSNVKLVIVDVLGREVATVVDGYETAGNKSVEFDASILPSGVYFYRLTAGSFSDMKKMLLAK